MSKNTTTFEFSMPVMLGWSHVFEPNKDGFYDADFLLPLDHPDAVNLRKVLAHIAAHLATGSKENPLARVFEGVIFCLKNGDALAAARRAKGKADLDFYADHLVVKSRSQFPIALAAIQNGQPAPVNVLTATNAQKGMFFCGAECYGAVELNVYGAGPMAPKGGVNAYLSAISLTGKGERKAGGTSVRAMNLYRGHVTAVDPTRSNGIPV